MDFANSVDNTVKIYATIDWMSKWYDILNRELFSGKLGTCGFHIFKKGAKTLGLFSMSNTKCERNSRRMFKELYGDRVYITNENFTSYCNPRIGLNGNYKATEQTLLGTLVHEMCHYYTYMNGYAPVQAHGTEFRHIGQIVSSRSNGYFTIQRLASAEEMADYELDSNVKQKMEAAKERRFGKSGATLIIYKSGTVSYVQSSNSEFIPTSIKLHRGDFGVNIVSFLTSNDSDLIKYMRNHGYKLSNRSLISYYYNITNKPWKEMFKNYDFDLIYGENPFEDEENQSTLSVNIPDNTQSNTDNQVPDDNSDDSEEDSDTPSEKPGYHNGYKAIEDKNGFNLVDNSGHKMFGIPVDKLWFENNQWYFQMGKFVKCGGPHNWKNCNEMKNLKMSKLCSLIQEAIEKVINEKLGNEPDFDNTNDDSDCIEITSDMNLGEYSPFEYNEGNY